MGWLKGFSIEFIASMLLVDFLVLLLISRVERGLFLGIIFTCSVCGSIGAIITSASEASETGEIKNAVCSKRRPPSSSMPYWTPLTQRSTLQTAPSQTPVHTAEGMAQTSDVVVITYSSCRYEFLPSEEPPFCPRCGADV